MKKIHLTIGLIIIFCAFSVVILSILFASLIIKSFYSYDLSYEESEFTETIKNEGNEIKEVIKDKNEDSESDKSPVVIDDIDRILSSKASLVLDETKFDDFIKMPDFFGYSQKSIMYFFAINHLSYSYYNNLPSSEKIQPYEYRWMDWWNPIEFSCENFLSHKKFEDDEFNIKFAYQNDLEIETEKYNPKLLESPYDSIYKHYFGDKKDDILKITLKGRPDLGRMELYAPKIPVELDINSLSSGYIYLKLKNGERKVFYTDYEYYQDASFTGLWFDMFSINHKRAVFGKIDSPHIFYADNWLKVFLRRSPIPDYEEFAEAKKKDVEKFEKDLENYFNSKGEWGEKYKKYCPPKGIIGRAGIGFFKRYIDIIMSIEFK